MSMPQVKKLSSYEPLGATTVSLRHVDRGFSTSEGEFFALRDVSLELAAGDLAAVVGGSGSGKSTLLNLIAGIDRPSAGEVWVARSPIHELAEDALARFRAEHVGIVFQFFQLLPTLTALENVVLPMDFVGSLPAAARRERAHELLERVGVKDQANKFPDALSGGQQQRVAIARALANDPPLVVADEPTGNLDSRTAHEVLMLFAELSQGGKTVLLVTHEREHRSLFRRIFELSDGRLLPDARLDSTGEAPACTG